MNERNQSKRVRSELEMALMRQVQDWKRWRQSGVKNTDVINGRIAK